MIRVKGYPQLRRDPSTGALININFQELQKNVSLEKRIETLEKNVNKIMDYLNIKDEMNGDTH